MALVLAALLVAPRTQAVIFYSTGDANHNTGLPTGDLAGSGAQYQGIWRGFGGTPVAPNLFVTAQHVGGSVGEEFQFDGARYRTAAAYADPESDLIVWRVCGVFPRYAPLYSGSDETGQSCVLWGRGLSRGGEMILTNGTQTILKGWYWGTADGRLRWGENVVKAIVDTSRLTESLLKFEFNAGAGPNEAMLANGDSGSGLFLKEGGVWVLAGVNYAVDGPFNTVASGTGFFAALFDMGGLYARTTEGEWAQVQDRPADRPASCYATRIARRRAWLEAILARHAASDVVPVLQSAPRPEGAYTDEPATDIDVVNGVIRWARPSGNRFYRLRECVLLKISGFSIEGGDLVLRYAPWPE
ncbi:MAG TPA: hypothetical protein PKM73_17670 [Verrucomicrobiota bacterium]|nr:hypothetical protein [Verrucomicrobiota bacterium]HNU49530.1 hypothetical protein [Verrucomicrobiota bacterium]